MSRAPEGARGHLWCGFLVPPTSAYAVSSSSPHASGSVEMIMIWRSRSSNSADRFWSFVSTALATQSDGRRLFVWVAQDVTKQKAHEEQVQLLAQEISHRTKNMLSLLQAIARLSV